MVRYDSMEEYWHQEIKGSSNHKTIAADRLPLEVVGNVKVPVSLGNFESDQ